MARRITRKELLKKDDFLETAPSVAQWFEENWKPLAGAAAGAIVVVLLIVAWSLNQKSNREEAMKLLAQGQQRFDESIVLGEGETAGFEEALVLFEEAVDRSPRSEAALVARYFRAASLQRLGRLDEARDELAELTSAAELPATLRGSALAVLAGLYEATGDSENAVRVWTELSADAGSLFPADQALMELGRAHRNAGNTDLARQAWQTLIDDHPESPLASEARLLLDR